MWTSVDEFLRVCRDRVNQEYTRLQQAEKNLPHGSPVKKILQKSIDQVAVISESFPAIGQRASNYGVALESLITKEVTPPEGVEPIEWSKRRLMYHRAMAVAFETQIQALQAESIRKTTPKEENQ